MYPHGRYSLIRLVTYDKLGRYPSNVGGHIQHEYPIGNLCVLTSNYIFLNCIIILYLIKLNIPNYKSIQGMCNHFII